jgi:SAM-dependent methyltransferase
MNYVHPITKQPLRSSVDGMHLLDSEGSVMFTKREGCFDFVSDTASRTERAYYDKEHEVGWSGTAPLDEIDLARLWREGLAGADMSLLESLGDLRGKCVLLLGNGTSVHEYHFINLGATLVYTDLSITAVVSARKRYLASKISNKNPNRCEFAAINAYYLPFAEDSFDVVYGVAFIHHMNDPVAFFAEVKRVLKPRGICRFADTAVSPLWQGAKRTVLHPLQVWSHRKHGISPEDVEATRKGGFTEAEMEGIRTQLGFGRLYFRRIGFFDYLLWRTRCKFSAAWMLAFRPFALSLDRWLANHTRFIQKQGITLVAGYDIAN